MLHAETAGHGPALVLLHGWGLHSGVWAPVLEALQSRLRVTAIDLPGHGHSRRCPAGSLTGMAEDVAAVAPPGATWLGWSLGAQVTLAAALGGADIRRLVLVAATPRFVSGPDWPWGVAPATLAGFASALADDPVRTVRNFLTLQLRGDRRAGELLAALQQALATRPAAVPAALRAGLEILSHTDLRAGLGKLGQAALVIAGERDRLTPVEAGRRLAEGLEGGRLLAFPGAAHTPFLAQPEAFAAAVTGFVQAEDRG